MADGYLRYKGVLKENASIQRREWEHERFKETLGKRDHLSLGSQQEKRNRQNLAKARKAKAAKARRREG